MRTVTLLVALVVALLVAFVTACGAKTARTPTPKTANPVQPAENASRPELPADQPHRSEGRLDLHVDNSPMDLAVVGSSLLWTDATGAIWTMPTRGGEPRRLSDQKQAFALGFARAGDKLYASGSKDILRVGLPAGPVEAMHVGLADMSLELVGDATALYCAVFKRTEVMRIPLDGGKPQKLFDLPRAILAVSGDKLYAISYTTGALLAVPTAGGAKPTTIATGFARPTALAVDDHAAYVYSEKERTLTRHDFATGSRQVLAKDLENSDWLLSDGEWLYTVSWPSRLLRVRKDGQRVEDLATDLGSPYGLAVDAEAVYVASRDQNLIVRIPK